MYRSMLKTNCKLYTTFHQLISFPNSYRSERHYSKQNSISFHPSNLVFESNHSVHSTFPEKHTVFNRCTSTQSRDQTSITKSTPSSRVLRHRVHQHQCSHYRGIPSKTIPPIPSNHEPFLSILFLSIHLSFATKKKEGRGYDK